MERGTPQPCCLCLWTKLHWVPETSPGLGFPTHGQAGYQDTWDGETSPSRATEALSTQNKRLGRRTGTATIVPAKQSECKEQVDKQDSLFAGVWRPASQGLGLAVPRERLRLSVCSTDRTSLSQTPGRAALSHHENILKASHFQLLIAVAQSVPMYLFWSPCLSCRTNSLHNPRFQPILICNRWMSSKWASLQLCYMPRQKYSLLNSFQKTAAHFPHHLGKQTIFLNMQRGEREGKAGIYSDRTFGELQASVRGALGWCLMPVQVLVGTWKFPLKTKG